MGCASIFITKTLLFKYVENFTSKNWNFLIKTADIFHISAQNIDCGYSLEPLSKVVLTSIHNLCFEQKKENNVYPCKPHFYYIKVGFKGVKII